MMARTVAATHQQHHHQQESDECDGDYLGAYRRFLEHFVANVARPDDQLPVRMGRRDVRDCELPGEIADITLKHLNQRKCPPSLQAYLVKLVIDEFKIIFQKQPEECGYRTQDKTFSPLKLMQTVTSKVNEICQRYLDNSRLALLPPPPSIPLPLASSHAIRNRRRQMEDRSTVLHDLHTMFSIKNDAVVNYYAVFDGHGGQDAATYCAAHLHQYLLESPYYPMDLENALRDAFQTTDYRFIECDDNGNSGATAVCALLYNKTLYIAWAGDSQAALIKNGRGINLTIPHKPERPDEKERIEQLGGEIIHFGSWRVNGVLNVSRSIGDVKYKPFISEEPEVKKIELDGTEDFLIIACDGFWERATEDIVAALLYEYVGSRHCNYNSASEALVQWAKQNLSDDNISVIVVYLTPPGEIAAKSFFEPRSRTMEPGYRESEQLQAAHVPSAAAPYDLDGYAFGKQQQSPLIPQLNGSSNGEDNNGFAMPSLNDRHRLKPPKYNDEDDDDDEEEEVDLGPETNVDAVDEAPEDYGKLDEARGQNYPDEFLVKMPAKREDDEFPLEMNKHQQQQNELIAEADNVADSEDSDDEWNYYRPDDNNKTSSSLSGDSNAPANNIASNVVAKDPALVEKSDDQCEEKEPCSPTKDAEEEFASGSLEQHQQQYQHQQQAEEEEEEHLLPENQPVSPVAGGEDDVTAEFDELHLKKEEEAEGEEAHLELKDTDTEDIPFDKDQHHFAEPEHRELPEEHREDLDNKESEEINKEEEQYEDYKAEIVEKTVEVEPLSTEALNLLTQTAEDFYSKHNIKDSEDHAQNFDKYVQIPFTDYDNEESKGANSDNFENEVVVKTIDVEPLNTEPLDFFAKETEEFYAKNDIEESEEHLQNTEKYGQIPLTDYDKEESKSANSDDFEREVVVKTLELETQSTDARDFLNQKAEAFYAQRDIKDSNEHLQNLNEYGQIPLTDHDDVIAATKIDSEQLENDPDMESHLNPDAAEFIPTSPVNPQLNIQNDLVAGSPLKQSQRALKNRIIPSEEEFTSEIRRRPSEIDDSVASDYSNGEASEIAFENEAQKTVINANTNLDVSEISSTRAEYGDESIANYSTASEYTTASGNALESTFFNNQDQMATSMTPRDFKNAFEESECDLNKVHELNDEDMIDVHNGSMEDKEGSDKDIEDDEDIVKEKIEVDFDNFVPQQQQNAGVFSAVLEEKKSADNNDLFMNMRNTEQNKEEVNLMDAMECSEVTSTENEKAEFGDVNDEPTYASNNPFATDYVSASELDQLTGDLQNVHLEEPKQLIFEDERALTPEEPEMQKESVPEVMLNPLELNVGATSAEQKRDEQVLVSPIIEPEVMSSKFAEEDLMSKSFEAPRAEPKEPEIEEFQKANHLEDYSPVSSQPEQEETKESPLEEPHETFERKSINLSESLQEFTGLEEQLSPKHEIKEEQPILKENLVEEQKDIEEVSAPSPVPEPKVEEAPAVTNEVIAVSNEITASTAAPVIAAATTAVAVAAAAAAATVAAKPSSKTTTASKTSKLTATSKIGAKSTTPTSPTKTGITAKASATSTAKKPASNTTAPPRKAAPTTTKSAMGTLNKTTTSTTKTTAAPRVSTTTAAKSSPRPPTTAAPRTKPLGSITSKISSTSTDKKPTTNGEAKAPTKTTATTRMVGKLAPTSAAPKTGLVKTSTTMRTTTGVASNGIAKTRTTSAATTKTTSTRLSSTTVSSSTNSSSTTAASRPKTAPTSTPAAKSKVGSLASKSPMIDKQIKETANKQISSARSATTTTTAKSRLSTLNSSSTSTTTTTTKRMSLVQKQTIAGSPKKPAPIAKPPPITKPGSKTGTTASKATSKVSSTTKISSTVTGTETATAMVVQNGVCEAEETKINTTTTTTNIEEDLPKKDISPIEPLTDNQLITAE